MPMKKTAKILKMSKASMGSDSASTMEAGASKYGFWVESLTWIFSYVRMTCSS